MAVGADFLSYIVSLAPEGETVLLVRQKQVMHNGSPQLHADGSPKYTWPAFLPAYGVRPKEAWYANTGSFIVSRFEKRKPPSASAANCEFVIAMMLDDIGTKSKTPPLPPTWIMETSPGSFQWGYAFQDQPSKQDYAAAITAIAAAGYTDPGACNAVRNFRLPGSVNLKPGRDGFVARLVEFHPDREFTLPQICEALGVVPGEADTAVNKPIHLADTGTDVVLKWLSDNGLVLSPANGQGWLGVVCPNKDAHTDGQIEGRYKPVDRSYCCLHAHCDGLDSTVFLKWVAEQGGPDVRPGLRDDLLASTMAAALGKLEPTETFPDTGATVVAEVERRELGRVEKAKWYERFAYIAADDAYFDLQDRREISRGTFNALFRHIPCRSIHDGKRKVEASVAYDESRQALGGRVVAEVTYAAGASVLVSRDGDVLGNRWIDARPPKAGPGDVSLWLAHCRTMVPDPEELEHCWNVMAYKLQHPDVKINHAVLHGGDEGCGKDTMWAPFIWSVCGPAARNRGMIDNEGLNSQWGYQLESEILILNELKEPEARERRALANKLKPIIAAPPETLVVNRKGLHPYSMVNRTLVLAFTNDPVPITLETQDRRWFCVWSHAGRMAVQDAKTVWGWYNSGGFGKIARWLYDRDVSKFNPAAAPLLTDYKISMIEQGHSMTESYLIDMIRARVGEFSKGIVAAPFHAVCDRLSGAAPSGSKVMPRSLLHALKEAGWVDCGRLNSHDFTTKKHIFAVPSVVKENSKSDLRRMAEDVPVTKLSLVKG